MSGRRAEMWRKWRAVRRGLLRLLCVCAAIGLLVGCGCVIFFDRLFQTALPLLVKRLPFQLQVGKASVGWSGVTLENVRVLNLRGKTIGSTEKAHVQVHYLRGWWNSRPLLALGDIQVDRPACTVEIDREGRLNWVGTGASPANEGPSEAAFWRDYTGSLSISQGFVHFRDERESGFLYELHQLNGRVTVKPGSPLQLQLSGSALDTGRPDQLEISGQVDVLHPQLNLHLNTRGLGLAELALYPLVQQQASIDQGAVDLDLQLRGSSPLWSQMPDHLRWQGQLQLSKVAGKFGPRSVPLSGFSGQIRLVAGQLQLEHFKGKLFHAPFDLSGRIQLPEAQSPPSFDLSAHVPSFDLSELSRWMHLKSRLQGRVRLDGRLEGQASDPHFSGGFEASQLVYLGRKVATARARFELDRGALHVLSSRASVTGSDRLSAQGWVFLDKPYPLWLQVQGHQPHLSEWVPALASVRGAHFGTDFSVSATGTLDRPLIIGEGQLSGAPANQLGLSGGTSHILADAQSLFLWGGQLQGGSRKISVPWGFVDLRDRYAAAALDSNHFTLPPLDISGKPIAGDLSGHVVGWGSLDHLDQLRAVADVRDGVFRVPNANSITGLHGNVWWSGTTAGFPQVMGSWDGGEISLTGTARPLQHSFDLGFSGRNISLDQLAQNPWLNLPVQPHERASVLALWQGSPRFSSFALSTLSPGGAIGAIGERQAQGDFGVNVLADHFPASALVLGRTVVPGRLTGQLTTQPVRPGLTNYWTEGTLTDASPRAPAISMTSNGSQQKDRIQLEDAIFSWGQPTRPVFGPYLLEGEVSVHQPARVNLIPVSSWRYAEADQWNEPGWGNVQGAIPLKGGQLGLRFHTRKLDVAWLAREPLGRGKASLSQSTGLDFGSAWLDSEGRIGGVLGDPRVSAELYSPWLSLSRPGQARSLFSASARMQADRRELQLSPFWLSAQPQDALLATTSPGQLPSSAEDGRLRGVGQLWFGPPGRLDMRLASQGFPVEAVRNLLPSMLADLRISGKAVSNDFHLYGPLAALSADGAVELAQAQFWSQGRAIPIQEARLALSSQGGALKLSDLQLRSGPLTVTGQGGRDRQGYFSAALQTNTVPLDYLHQFGKDFEPFQGDVHLSTRVQGGPGLSPTLLMAADSSNLVWNNPEGSPILFKSLRVGTTEHPVRLHFEAGRLIAEIPDGVAETELSQGGDFKMAGRVAVRKGPSGNLWSWVTSADGPDFGQAGQPFSAAFSGIPWVAVRDGLGLRVDQRRGSFGGRLQLTGQLAALAPPAASGRTRQKSLKKPASLPRLGLDLDQLWLEGPGAGGLSGVRLRDHLNASLAVGGREGLWFQLAPSTLQFYHRPPGLSVNGYSASVADSGPEVPGGSVTAEANLELAESRRTLAPNGEPQNLGMSVQALDFGDLGFVFPGVSPLTGQLKSVKISAQDALPRTRARLEVEVGQSKLGALNLAALHGGLELVPDGDGHLRVGFVGPTDQGQLQVYFGDKVSEQQLLRLRGNVGLDLTRRQPNRTGFTPVWDLWRLDPHSGLALSADVKDQSMSLVEAFLPRGSETTGNLQGHLDLSGTVARPQLSGAVQIDNATFQHPLLATGISKFNLAARFQKISAGEATPSALDSQLSNDLRSRYTVDKFEGLLGQRPFSGSGKAELAGLRPTYLDFQLHGEQLPIGIQGLFSGHADVALGLHTRLDTLPGSNTPEIVPFLDGSIRVPEAELKVPLAAVGGSDGAPGSSQSPIKKYPFLYDVNLHLGDNVWVGALGSRVRTEGDLRLHPSPATHLPVLAGSLYLSRGVIHIPLYEVNFLVRQGYARFDNSLMPRFDNVAADTTFGSYQITARVDGTYPDVHVDLISNPPLPTRDLQSLVSTGGGNNGSSGLPASQLDQQQSAVGSQGLLILTNLLTAPLTQSLGKLFFLSEVSFDVQPPYDYVIKLAKALDNKDKFLITLIQVISSNHIVNDAASQYGLEWRFQPNLLTRISYASDSTYRLWFQGVVRFLGL